MKKARIGILTVLSGLILFMSGCLNDDDQDFTGNVEASDQIVAQNNILVEEISLDRAGWVIVHESMNGSLGDIISSPAYISSAGSFVNNYIPLDSTAMLTDSMDVVIKLYYDNGTIGEFDSEDMPVEINGQEVSSSILLAAPVVTIANQAVQDDQVVVDEIKTGISSWVAVYKVDEQGLLGDLVGVEPVQEANLSDYEVQLTDTVDYIAGNRLAAVLHLNNTPVEQFNFPGNDVPLVFGFDDDNLVYDTFVIQ